MRERMDAVALEPIGLKTLGLVHINDYPADPPRGAIADSDRVHPGDGIAPLKRSLSRLAQAGCRGLLEVPIAREGDHQISFAHDRER